jgi:ABC-type transport system substrate-binding protein
MTHTALTRRTVLGAALATGATVAGPFVRGARSAAEVVPEGKLVLAWHTNIATRWLDPQQHDGTASPDNFLMTLQDALIKNFREVHYDHPALASGYEFAEDAKSATFHLRPGIKFHDGSLITPADVKWSYEHYRGAWGDVLHKATQDVEIVDDHTVRFHFLEPFFDFPILLGTGNVCGAGWVVPAKYYEQVGADGFMQKPVGAGPYRLAAQQPGMSFDFEAFDDYYRLVHVKQLTMVSVPEAVTRVAMLERGEADIIYNVPGELIDRIRSNPKLVLAPVVSANFWLEFPGFGHPKNPFHDKRVRQAVSLAIDRDAMNQAECDGLGRVDGNWINDDVEYGMPWPKWEHNIPKAEQLMAEAGFPNGFNVDWVTPLPDYYSRGERIVSQLQARCRPWNAVFFLRDCRAGSSNGRGCRSSLTPPGSAGLGQTGTTALCAAAVSTAVTATVSPNSMPISPNISPRPTATNARGWPLPSNGRSWKTIISCRYSAMPRCRQSDHASRRRSGRTSSRR